MDTNPLRARIVEVIRRQGPIPFSRYMAMCLYEPELGYYMRPREQFGKAGDFYTSSDVHALFGRLLCRQFVEFWQALGAPGVLDLIAARSRSRPVRRRRARLGREEACGIFPAGLALSPGGNLALAAPAARGASGRAFRVWSHVLIGWESAGERLAFDRGWDAAQMQNCRSCIAQPRAEDALVTGVGTGRGESTRYSRRQSPRSRRSCPNTPGTTPGHCPLPWIAPTESFLS